MYSRICSAKFGFALSLSLRKCLRWICIADINSGWVRVAGQIEVDAEIAEEEGIAQFRRLHS